METETAPVEVAAAPVAAAAPVVPKSLAAAYDAVAVRAKAPAAPVAETPVAAPVKAAAAKPAPAAKAADPLDAAAAEIVDPNHVPLPFDDIEEPAAPDEGTSDERVGRRIEMLKAERKTLNAHIAEKEETIKQRDSRLAELEAFATERDDLLERVKGYEAEMSIAKLEKTPAFIKEVTEPEGKIVGNAMKIIEHYGLSEKDIFAALEEPDAMKRSAAFKAATSGMDVDPDHAYELRKLADEAQTVLARRAELYQNADAALAELGARTEKETATQVAARAEERVKATDLVVERIAKKLPFLNAIVRGVADAAKGTNFEALDPQKQAYNVLMGEALPKLAVAHAKLQAQYDAALDEIAAFTKASPRVDGGLARSGPGGAQPRSLAEAAAMAAGQR